MTPGDALTRTRQDILYNRGQQLALFCRANRTEQCRLSGVNQATYAHCEVFVFRIPRLYRRIRKIAVNS